MGKINDETLYSIKPNPVLEDFVIGTDSVDSNKKTLNFSLQKILELFIASTPAITPPQNRPYKVYTAIISQLGTSDPVVNQVLENSLGDIVFTRSYTGSFYINSSNLFTLNKTVVFLSNGRSSNSGSAGYEYASSSLLSLSTINNSTIGVDGYLRNSTIEIRVYN